MSSSKTIIIKPASSSCNLRCSYCYNGAEIHHRSKSGLMSIGTLEGIYNLLPQLNVRVVKLIWHGGEPLVRGLGFYKTAVALQKKLCEEHAGLKIDNSLMTNGTLLTDEWIEFFKENDWHIGISLDGTADIHNKYRVTAQGKGSFDTVFENIKKVNKAGLQIGLISVITKNTVAESDPKEMYGFLKSVSRNFEISPCWETSNNGNVPEYVVSPDLFLNYAKGMFDAWWQDDNPKIRIRFFSTLVQGAIGGKPQSCSFNGTCSHFFAIDADGGVYPCGKFAGIPELYLGNIHESSIENILSGEIYKSYLERVAFVPEKCKECKWYQSCHNGCTYERYLSKGKFSDISPFCEIWENAYEYADAKAQEVMKEQMPSKPAAG